MSKAKRILELYWDGKLPVDVRKICSKLKVNIRDIGPSAMVIAAVKGCTMIINEKQPLVKERYMIAHCLAYIVNKHSQGKTIFITPLLPTLHSQAMEGFFFYLPASIFFF